MWTCIVLKGKQGLTSTLVCNQLFLKYIVDAQALCKLFSFRCNFLTSSHVYENIDKIAVLTGKTGTQTYRKKVFAESQNLKVIGFVS